MLNKIKQISNYVLFILFSNVIYGLILWYSCTWLAGYSLLYAYLCNLTLIVLGLALDEAILKSYQSKKLVRQIKNLKNEKDVELNYRFTLWTIDHYVSFKAVLYLFYIFILIISQIINFSAAAVGDDPGNFILVTQYSILLLVAYDLLVEQFFKDRERMKEVSGKFKEHFTENQD